jgi:hypothetical protein
LKKDIAAGIDDLNLFILVATPASSAQLNPNSDAPVSVPMPLLLFPSFHALPNSTTRLDAIMVKPTVSARFDAAPDIGLIPYAALTSA